MIEFVHFWFGVMLIVSVVLCVMLALLPKEQAKKEPPRGGTGGS